MPWESRCNQHDKCDECKFSENKVVASISSYANVTTTKNETALAMAVLEQGPVSVCIDSEPWQLYSGGVLTKCGQQLDHCVLIVGAKCAANSAKLHVSCRRHVAYMRHGWLAGRPNSDVSPPLQSQ